jgi:glycosyltransferase involved in cell wall biosynthesis
VPPHLVHLTTQLPEPRGGPTRQFHLLREAALAFDVTVLAGQGAGPPSPEALAPLERFARVLSLAPEPWRRGPAHRTARLARMALSPRPYTAARYDPLRGPAVAALASLERPPDLLHVEPSNVAGWLDLAPRGCARVLGFHDVLFAVERDAARLGGASRRLLGAVEWRKLRGYESRSARAADLCVMTSESDAAMLGEIAPRARTLVVANGVDCNYFQPSPALAAKADLVVFTGSMNHPPNRRAAMRLATEILPAIRALRPDARLEIVGRQPDHEVRALGEWPGVTVVGEVPDIRPHLARAAVVVAPIEFGGGVRNKVLEALAAGRAVVCTPKGAEGLEVRDGEHLVVSDLEAVPRQVAELLGDADRRERLGAVGRVLVQERYDWSALGARFTEGLSGLIRA